MKFKAWTDAVLDEETLKKDFDRARGIGAVSIGEKALYFRKLTNRWYVPYEAVERCFRRVNEVSAKMGCCMGSYDRESLIVNAAGREPVDISLPDTRAARAVMTELGKYLPDSKLGCLPKEVPGEGIPAAQ